MFKPLIGISCGVEAAGANWLLRSYYGDAVRAFGGLFVLLPSQKPEDVLPIIKRLDGLLLAGGGDIHPSFWDEEPLHGLGKVDIERDGWEIALFNAAKTCGLPILGICRGMQIINVACGGSLWQQKPGINAHVQTSSYNQVWHKLNITNPDFALMLKAEQALVNSCHHQCIRRLGRNLRVAAKAADGIVEAILGEKNIWAVQWHPEYLWREEGISRELFNYFIKQCM